jgi:Rod binding domain-containing protein
MRINANTARSNVMEAAGQPAAKSPAGSAGTDNPKLRKAFDSFVGESFYGQMLKSMRTTVGKPAYFYGGHAEEIFTQQLDQVLSRKLSEASADKFTGPMYQLFTMGRR